jgi:hypothetical protein
MLRFRIWAHQAIGAGRQAVINFFVNALWQVYAPAEEEIRLGAARRQVLEEQSV